MNKPKSIPCLREVVAALLISFLFSTGNAAVLHVPGDYTAIQQAIDHASNSDIILVSPGSYHENINFRGKAITVSSTNTTDPAVVGSTVIHGTGQGSVVSFATGEKTNSVLAGLTITGGYGTVNPNFGTGIVWGAGIYCYLSSPTIVGNIITANSSLKGDTNIVGYGCGIACIQSDAIISRNVIATNTGYAGGGILTYLGKARIVSNLIYSNTVVVGGAAVLISGGQFLNNTAVGNAAEFAGNIYATSDVSGQSLVIDNIICGAGSGGGIYLDSTDNLTRIAFNDVWNNVDGDYYQGTNRTGIDGNISQDPQFVDAVNHDFRLQDTSPCLNSGDPNYQPAPGELDFYGNARVFARRVDIGAAEYVDHFRPLADAGPDQSRVVTSLPASIALDGTASSDPNGVMISYHWSQIAGPPGTWSGEDTAKPAFNAFALGTYAFELVVNNGSFSSFPDSVQVTLKNDPPTADAGDDQRYSDSALPILVTLDGSRSRDPEHVALRYRWRQVGGWSIPLSDPTAAQPSVTPLWPGSYTFELVVNDGIQDSQPDVVKIVIGPNHAPVANAGPDRFVATGSVVLEGAKSYDPDGPGTLTYQWRQISGPTVAMLKTNTPNVPIAVTPKTSIQKCVFELIVSDGELVSAPAYVTVTIVPNYGNNVLVLNNPPFNSARPTIVAFGGGNCSTGSGMTFGGVWDQKANWITVNTYGPPYAKYGDMLMVYLSGVAPDYKKPVQTLGFSTGNLPAMEVGWYVNATYKDPRYAVNRVSLLDAVCTWLVGRVSQFHANPIAGEQCWVDNYISNDPGFSQQPTIAGALNIVCGPPRAHAYPVQRYASSSLDYTNGGLVAFAYLSAIGNGRNYQLNTASQKYTFLINSQESIVLFNPAVYPGKMLAPVNLTGPADGDTLTTNGATFSCEPVENAVGYRLLFGSDPDRVMDYSIVSDTPTPPTQTITTLPYGSTWWTVRAYDQFGSTIYADPKLIKQPDNRPPVADAGPDQVVYAGLDGIAKVTLDGSRSTDPEGNALSFTWAWAIGANAYLSNGVNLTLELPVGVYKFQLMANDGHQDSLPDEVTVTVVAPLECRLDLAPSTINLNSNQKSILARIQLPAEFTRTDLDGIGALLLYPGGLQAVKQWTVVDDVGLASVYSFFDKDALTGELQIGSAELKVVGTLRSGQVIYGRGTIRVIGNGNGK